MERRQPARPSLGTSSRGVTIALLLLGIVSAAAITATGHGLPLMVPDSDTYIAWLPSRTPLYPLFLWIVAAISPGYSLVPWLQYAALIVATAMFASSVGELLKSPLVGGAVGIAIFVNVYLTRYASSILTDSFYVALIMIHCACVLRAIHRPSLVWPLWAGLALGCAILVRPVGYALLFAVPFLPLVWWNRRIVRTAILVAGCVVPLLIACAGNYAVRGYFATQAFGGINLALQTATLMPQRIEGLDADAIGRAYAALEPLRQAEARAESWPVLDMVETETFNQGQGAILRLAADLADAQPQRWNQAKPYGRDIALNAEAWEVAIKTVEQKPAAYIAKVIRQFYGMWFIPQKADPATARRLADILGDTLGPEATAATMDTVRALPWPLWAAKMIVFGAMLAAAAWIVVAAPFRRDPAFRGLAYLALATIFYFGVTAGVEVAITRYSLAAWPEQCAVLVGAALLIWRRRTAERSEPKGSR